MMGMVEMQEKECAPAAHLESLAVRIISNIQREVSCHEDYNFSLLLFSSS